MPLNLKNPLAIFDLETTGANVMNDRIIEYSFIKVMPNGETIEKSGRVNPTIPIKKDARMVHGISNDDVKDEPTFKMIAKELARFLEGCDLAGFNIIRFDVPVLVEEFLREGVEFDVSKRKLIDAQKIFHFMEKRTLGAAYQFYCNKSLDDAHSATADTAATLEVLDAQIARYEGQEVTSTSGKKLGRVENNMSILHDITASNMVDLAGRFVLNNNGVEIFNFGKHKNKPVTEVLEKEPGYYDWMMRGEFPLDTKRRLTEIKLRAFNSR